MAGNPMLWLAGDRNLIREADLVASGVLPVANQVIARPVARDGTGQATISGAYSGDEAATFEIEILDDDVDERLISAPVFTGRGSGTLEDIVATGTPQSYTVELRKPASDPAYAAIEIEGVAVTARNAGPDGNDISITVDRDGLTFTLSDYSTLADIAAGGGSATAGLSGPGFDWDAQPIGANDAIPADAHRVAFGDDRSNIHLSYKRFADGAWSYHLVPAATRAIPAGTPIYFVTGGREVSITDASTSPVTVETYPDIVTAYDLLNALKGGSALVTLDGVVANDRTPTGQAARELTLRTDSHAELSTGTGSKYAQLGFDSIEVDPAGTSTEIITATAVAVSPNDHPLAALGHERWSLKGSLSGDLGIILTGEVYEHPDGRFALRVPTRLPAGFGTPKGRFAVTGISYATRGVGETEPPICPVSLSLGPAAVDQTITLEYVARPSGDCNCSGMPKPNLNTNCLGNAEEGGEAVSYQDDTIARLITLRTWYADTVRQLSAYPATGAIAAQQAPAVDAPLDVAYGAAVEGGDYANSINNITPSTKSLKEIVDLFESILALIDPLAGGTGSYRDLGGEAWDSALTELQGDVSTHLTDPTPQVWALNIPSARYEARLGQVLITAGLSPLGESDASALESGDGCWRDYGDAYYWQVVGSVGGGYAPLFSNRPYYSSRESPASRKYFSTREFALQLNIKCPEDLKVGDTVTLVISQASWGATYQLNDEMRLPIVGAGPQYLSGGDAGDSVDEWYVSGSVDGPLPAYEFDNDAPAAYAGETGLSFLLAPGGVPFEQGDKFTFAAEGGHYRWRKDGGAWDGTSPPLAISATPAALSDGLSVAFAAGSARSFVAGDVFRFRALQPWALSNVTAPTLAAWKWAGSAAALEIDLGSLQTLDTVALVHDLPEGATVTLYGGAGTGDDWSESLTWREHALWKVIDRQARYLRLEVASATDGAIYWAWAGQALRTELTADTLLRLSYATDRAQSGMLQGGPLLGRAVSAEVEWSEGALSEDDVDALREMVDHCKENDDEPLLVILQRTRSAEAPLFARINQDEVDLPDLHGYQPGDAFDRRHSARLSLAGVWR